VERARHIAFVIVILMPIESGETKFDSCPGGGGMIVRMDEFMSSFQPNCIGDGSRTQMGWVWCKILAKLQ
jgi:hypothetical protein